MREQADDDEINVDEFVAVQLMYFLYTVFRLRREKTPRFFMDSRQMLPSAS
jgi:hypothetical protein